MDHKRLNLSFKHYHDIHFNYYGLKEYTEKKESRYVEKSLSFFPYTFPNDYDSDENNRTDKIVLWSVRNDFALGLKIPLYPNYI